MARNAKITMLGPRVPVADLRRARPREKITKGFYLSPDWRELMKRLKRERGARCQDCGNSKDRILGDHIHELNDGGAPLDPANVRLLCLPCHNQKTAREKVKRMARWQSKPDQEQPLPSEEPDEGPVI